MTTAPPPASPTLYMIHNTVRARHNRTQRAAAAQHGRFKHHIGEAQQRLVRGRPLVFTEKQVGDNIEELRAKQAAGILDVRTPDGRWVDLETGLTSGAHPLPKRPAFKLDSVADDTQIGQYMAPYLGDDGAQPQILPPGQKPALLTEAKEAADLDAQLSSTEVASTEVAKDPEMSDDTELGDLFDVPSEEVEEETPAPTEQEEVSSKSAPSGSKKGKKGNR